MKNAKYNNFELDIEALSCQRGDKIVFSDISVKLVSGEILTISGKNGSGKSSLLRTIAGFIKPIKGNIIFNRENIYEDIESFREEIIYISHKDPVKKFLSIKENLNLWSGFYSNDIPKINIDNAIDKFQLKKLENLPANVLSAGQIRRLNLSRLAITNRRIWLLDEPMNSLDKEAASLLSSFAKEHIEKNGLIIVASHGDFDLPSKALNLSD